VKEAKSMMTPRIALTMGDPAGIGPEIILKAVNELLPRIEAGQMHLLVIGCARTYRETAKSLGCDAAAIPMLGHELARDWPAIGILDAGPTSQPIVPGEVSAAAGQLAFNAVRIAVQVAMAGHAQAICTGPLNKQALNLAGHHFGGHTELLAHLSGATDSVMMLVHDNMRVSHVSTHIALKDVPAAVTPARLNRVFELTDGALRRLGIDKPRIAFAALNPHAGESGLFGREDTEITLPVAAELRNAGHLVYGPLPGDTIFVKLCAGEFDAVIAMYHDQGHIPVKLLGFQVDAETGKWSSLSGVNVTLGLPIVRTSVDHGTAFDIAGKGIANADSLIEAIELAMVLAAGRGHPQTGRNETHAKSR